MALFFEEGNVGLDIGTNSVKIIQLKSKSKAAKLVNYGLVELPLERVVKEGGEQGTLLIEAIKEAIYSSRIKAKKIFTFLSGPTVNVRCNVRVPQMSKSELAEAIKWEVKKFIAFPLSEAIIDYIIVNKVEERGSKNYEMVVVVVPKKVVYDHVSLIQETGLSIQAIDIAPFALIASFERNGEWREDEIIALIEMGAGVTNLSIIKNGSLRFNRELAIGGNHLTSALQRELGLELNAAEDFKKSCGLILEEVTSSPKEEELEVSRILRSTLDRLVVELQRSFDYYKVQSREGRIDRIILSGGSSKLKGLHNYLSISLGIPVEDHDPFHKIKVDRRVPQLDFLHSQAPRFSLGVGLALRER